MEDAPSEPLPLSAVSIHKPEDDNGLVLLERLPALGLRDHWRMSVSRLEPALLGHLCVEFGARGERAVEFLDMAQALLELEPQLEPRLGEVVAYCIREALTEIPKASGVGDAGGGRACRVRWWTRRISSSRRRSFPVKAAGGSSQGCGPRLMSCGVSTPLARVSIRRVS